MYLGTPQDFSSLTLKHLVEHYRHHWWWIRYKRGRFDCSPLYSRVARLETELAVRGVAADVVDAMRAYFSADSVEMMGAALRAAYAKLVGD